MNSTGHARKIGVLLPLGTIEVFKANASLKGREAMTYAEAGHENERRRRVHVCSLMGPWLRPVGLKMLRSELLWRKESQ